MKKKAQKKLHSRLKHVKKPRATAVILVFAAVGAALLFTTRAASPFASVDPNGTNSTITVPAKEVDDSTASGMKTVQFGSVASTGGNNGLLTGDPNFFPISVFSQTPEANASAYKAIGINNFAELYDGANQTNLTALKNASLFATSGQNTFALTNSLGSVVKGWMHEDEPDNAQADGNGGYGPCTTTATIQSRYNTFKAADSLKRPVIINFGAGAAYTNWEGRGSCSGDTAMYSQYAQGADILGFDIYPNAGRYGPAYGNGPAPITLVATGVDNLLSWGGGKPVWAVIETTDYNNRGTGPTTAQVKAEVWLALTHGATGIEYFAHVLEPTFHEAGLLLDSNMSNAVGAINSQIQSLALVLNSPTIANGATVSASTRVDNMVKKYNGATYLFAVNTASGTTSATFHPGNLTSGMVTVIGEGRTIPLSGNAFADSFAGYGVHLYQIN